MVEVKTSIVYQKCVKFKVIMVLQKDEKPGPMKVIRSQIV